MLKLADRMFEKLGYTKEDELSEHIVTNYEKYIEGYKYTKVIEIGRKKSGNHIISCYQKDTNIDGFNNSVGMTKKEIKAAMRKYKEMGL